jgi:hypothetical protein
MAHPYAAHRANDVQHRRVGHIVKGYGGTSVGKPHRADHTDAPEDRALVKAMVKPNALKRASGGAVKHRLDKPHRAKGGKVKHAKTNVNVIVGHGGGQPPLPVPVPAGGPPGIAMPRPPMPLPPPGMAPGLPPGIGPGMPPPGALGPRKSGGRTYAKGGRVKPGPGWIESEKNKTPVQHTDGKKDGKDIGRGRPITYRRGGLVS